jgi:DNA-binding MarR family transcriptional regulator
VLPLHQGGLRSLHQVHCTECCDAVTNSARYIADNFPARSVGDNGQMPQHDEVDRIVGAWERERPDLDFAPLQVLSRVGRLARHLDRARRAAFTASELESWEFDVLSALRRAGQPYQLSPKALLQQTLVSSGTMTNRIDRLVGLSLVERRTDPHDGRGILVVMTDKGRTRVDTAISLLLSAESELLDKLSILEQERLASLLRKLSIDFD